MTTAKGGPPKGYKQSARHKAKRARLVEGSSNGRWNGGTRSYRKIAGAKENDGSIVHHRDGNRKNNSKSNLQRLNDPPKGGGKAKPGRRTTVQHEKQTKRK